MVGKTLKFYVNRYKKLFGIIFIPLDFKSSIAGIISLISSFKDSVTLLISEAILFDVAASILKIPEPFDSIDTIASFLISFVFLIPYTASVYNGLSRLFGMAFDIPYSACVITMAALTGAYVLLGGYMATAINDFIQGIFMLFGIVVVVVSVLNGKGGFINAVHQLSMLESDINVTLGQKGAFASFFGPDPLNLLGVIVLTSLGTWGLPQMVHKFYAIKDDNSIKTGTIISTVFALIISGCCYFLGGFGRLFDSESIHTATGGVIYDAIIPSMLATLPDILMGVVIVLVLSASMSTLSSLVLTSSSTLTLDFIKDNFSKNMSEKKQLLCMRILLVFFIVVSVVIALDPPTFIAQLMGISWGALAGAFLAPFLYGLYSKRITKGAVWASFASGVGITVSNMYLGFIDSPINAGAIAMIAGLVIVPLVSFITPKIKKTYVDSVFSCYNIKYTYINICDLWHFLDYLVKKKKKHWIEG